MTEEGRAQFIGRTLDCVKCERGDYSAPIIYKDRGCS